MKFPLPFLPAISSAWLLATVAGAQVTLDVHTITHVPGGDTVVSDTENVVASSASVSTAYGSGTAGSIFGSMQLSSHSSSTHQAPYDDTLTTLAHAEAKWEDSILVTAAAPELDGTNGRLHVRFTVNGSLIAPTSVNSDFAGAYVAAAHWLLGVNRSDGFGSEGSVGGHRTLYVEWNGSSYEYLTLGTPGFQTFDLIIPFTFGEAFDFRVTGRVDTMAQPRGMPVNDGLSASSEITVTWLGLVGVTDEEDNPLSGITIASTGDWLTTSAIPEPSTYAALAGLAALGLAAWWRKARRI